MLTWILAVTLAMLPTGEGTRVELQAAAQVDTRTLDSSLPGKPPPGGKWSGGEGRFAITVFGRRVVDDTSAPALQPFLQKTSVFRFAGGGGGSSAVYPIWTVNSQSPSSFLSAYRGSQSGGWGESVAEGYARSWLYLRASLRFEHWSWHPVPQIVIGGFSPSITPTFSRLQGDEWSIHPSVALGGRWRDLLVFAGWSVTPFQIGKGTMQVRFWGNAFVGIRTVVRSFVDLAAQVEVLDEGASLHIGATIWLRRRIGLGVGLTGGRGAFADSPVVADFVGGVAELSWWFAPRLAGAIAYAPGWQQGTPVTAFGAAVHELSFVQHLVTFTLTSRPPIAKRD